MWVKTEIKHVKSDFFSNFLFSVSNIVPKDWKLLICGSISAIVRCIVSYSGKKINISRLLIKACKINKGRNYEFIEVSSQARFFKFSSIWKLWKMTAIAKHRQTQQY